MHAVAVELPRLCARQVAVPDVRRALRQGDAPRLRRRVHGIEEAQLDLGRVLGEDRKVHPLRVASRADRIRPARPEVGGVMV